MNFVLNYLQFCASGKLALTECGPAWQMSVIAVLLLLAVLTLIALRLRTRSQPSEA